MLAQTAPFDHCNMTVRGDDPRGGRRFGEALLAMSYADPQVRPLLDLEGLHQWVEGRVDHYGALERVVDETGFYDADGDVRARRLSTLRTSASTEEPACSSTARSRRSPPATG